MIRSLWKSLLWYLFAAWRWLAMVWKNSVAGTATAAITNAPTQTANALIVDEARRPRTERLIPASFIQGKKPRSLAAIDRDLQATTSRKEQLISEKATKKEPLLAVEKEVAEQLDSTYDPLIREAEQRIYELRRERELALIDYCYTRVDIAFLKVAPPGQPSTIADCRSTRSSRRTRRFSKWKAIASIANRTEASVSVTPWIGLYPACLIGLV